LIKNTYRLHQQSLYVCGKS